MIMGVIFDMDGLMVDTERLYLEVDHEVAAEFGKKFDEKIIVQMMGQKPLDALKIFINSLKIDIDPLELMKKRDKMLIDKMEHDLVPMEGLFEILEVLSREISLAIASGAPQKFVDLVVDSLDIRKYFTIIQSSDQVKHGKPDPEIYQKTVDRLHLLPESVIVLEDSSNGALAAKRAGCYVIAVPSVYSQNQDFDFVDHISASLPKAQEFNLSMLE